MKKRILAALVATIMIVSVFVFASCETDKDNSSDASVSDTSKEETKKELTPKELFSASFTNLSANAGNSSLLDFSQLAKNAKDAVAEFELKINKLSTDGENVTENGAIVLNGSSKTDTESGLASIDLSTTFYGETPTIGILTDGEKTYITDLLGVNEKPIALYAEDPEYESLPEVDADFVVNFVKKASESIEKNVNDDAFVQEIKDVTVAGKNFAGAKVITLTVTDETAKKIAGELIDELLKNEAFKSIYGDDFNKDEILSEIDLPTAVRIVNTVFEEKSIALDIELTLPEPKDDETSDIYDEFEDYSYDIDFDDDEYFGDDEFIYDDEYIDDDDFIYDDEYIDDDDFIYDDEYIDVELPEFNKFVLHANYVNNNFKLDLGPADENGKYYEEHGYLSCAYTLENGNENFVFSVTEFGETTEFIKLSGTYKDEKHEGTLTFDIDGQVISVKYSLSANDNTGSLKLTDLAFVVDGATVSFPFEVVTNYTANETKFDIEGSVKFSMEDVLDIDLDFSLSAEHKDVTLNAVTDYVPMEDFDISVYETAIAEKYPILYTLLESLETNDENYYDDSYIY